MNRLTFLPVLALGLLAAGCSSNHEIATGGEDSEEELTAAKNRIVGAYVGTFGKAPPTFEGLVFRKDGSFFAEVDTGIRCITTPCPSHVRLEGRYTVTTKTFELKFVNPTTDEDLRPTGSGPLFGLYRYALSSSKLTLTRPDGKGWEQSLVRQTSFCTKGPDCEGQGLSAPRCIGQWACADSQCTFDCGG